MIDNDIFEEKTVSVGELRDLFFDDDSEIEIETPDGYQKIVSWWDKGKLSMVEIELSNGSKTRCAYNHLLQNTDSLWLMANEIDVGVELLTFDGAAIVVSVRGDYPEECYDFEVDHPNHRYWGDGLSSHNSGKSYIVSGNIIKSALELGVGVVVLDTEGAIKKTWATALGVDTDNESIVRWSKRTINQVTGTIADFMDGYANDFVSVPREEQPPILFVIDSLGNLETEAGLKQFKEGELRGDQGLFAKQLKSMMRNIIGSIDGFQVGLVGTMHTYVNQNAYSDHEDIIAGGRGPIFLCDIVVNMNKSKLRGEEEVVDEKTGKTKKVKAKSVQGIVSKIKCVKSRYAKPFEEVEVNIPYDHGMDPYSGLFELFEKKVLRKEGNSYIYFSKEQNKEIKLMRKSMDNDFYDAVMREWDDSNESVGVNELPEDIDSVE